MKLYYAASSPYVRKVMVTALETGLDKKIETVPSTASPVQPNADLAKANPLMKIPALITDGGEPLYDSYVICDYLDSLHNGPKLLPTGEARWPVLRVHALATGVTDAGLLCRYEEMLRKPEQQLDAWRQGQLAKVNQGLDMLEREALRFKGAIDLGQIATACAIGWLEFRKPAGDIRKGRPNLFTWYDAFAKRPSMAATQPKA